MVVLVSDRYDECVYTMACAIYVELCPTDSHVSKLSRSADPDLHIFTVRCVDQEGVCFFLVGGCRANPADIAGGGGGVRRGMIGGCVLPAVSHFG